MSPPIVFVGANRSTWTAGAGTLSIATPTKVRARDALFMVVCLASPAAVLTGVDGSATFDGWTLVQTITTAANRVYLLRRDVTDTLAEPVAHTGTFTATTVGQAALFAFRGVIGPTLASGAANDSTATLNHVCPSQTLGAYSGLWLGVVLGANGTYPVVGPPGCSLALESYDGTSSIAIYYLLPEVAGATGTKTATTGTNRTGVAASYQLEATPVAGAGLTFAVSPIGAPGLPAEGI